MFPPTKPHPKTSLSLCLATTPADIPTLAEISSHAFRTDTHTALKCLIKGTNHADDMAPALESWIAAPNQRCAVLKAVTGEGEIAGWACWAFRGFAWDGEGVGEGAGQEEEEREEEGKGEEGKEEGSAKARKESAKIAALESLTNSTMTSFSSFFSSPSSNSPEHMILVAIAIRPSHQGTGVGSSLIHFGTGIADERNIFCWVSSSDGGYRVFEKNGFREVGRLGLLLDEFAEDGEGLRVKNPERGDGAWGMYTWRWMRRDASPVKGAI